MFLHSLIPIADKTLMVCDKTGVFANRRFKLTRSDQHAYYNISNYLISTYIDLNVNTDKNNK